MSVGELATRRKAENGAANVELRSIESITTELVTLSRLKCQHSDVYYPIHNASITNLSVVVASVSVPRFRCWLIPVHHYPVRHVTKEM